MALNMWFQEDVARILSSVAISMSSGLEAGTTDDEARRQAYAKGSSDTLRAVAVAFGIIKPIPDEREGTNERAVRGV